MTIIIDRNPKMLFSWTGYYKRLTKHFGLPKQHLFDGTESVWNYTISHGGTKLSIHFKDPNNETLAKLLI